VVLSLLSCYHHAGEGERGLQARNIAIPWPPIWRILSFPDIEYKGFSQCIRVYRKGVERKSGKGLFQVGDDSPFSERSRVIPFFLSLKRPVRIAIDLSPHSLLEEDGKLLRSIDLVI